VSTTSKRWARSDVKSQLRIVPDAHGHVGDELPLPLAVTAAVDV
jgi:hypothetical protein